MKVIWTEKAEKQLGQIFEYIAAYTSLSAHRTVGQIIEDGKKQKVSHPILEKVAKFQNMSGRI